LAGKCSADAPPALTAPVNVRGRPFTFRPVIRRQPFLSKKSSKKELTKGPPFLVKSFGCKSGLACCEGKLNHLGLDQGPKRGPGMFSGAIFSIMTTPCPPVLLPIISARKPEFPADGFYEWRAIGGTKIRFAIGMKDDRTIRFCRPVGGVERSGYRPVVAHLHDYHRRSEQASVVQKRPRREASRKIGGPRSDHTSSGIQT
jgi:hypothetical protein